MLCSKIDSVPQHRSLSPVRGLCDERLGNDSPSKVDDPVGAVLATRALQVMEANRVVNNTEMRQPMAKPTFEQGIVLAAAWLVSAHGEDSLGMEMLDHLVGLDRALKVADEADLEVLESLIYEEKQRLINIKQK